MYDALLDTNILIYASNPASKFQIKAKRLLQDVLEQEINACVSSQNLYEFYSIVTDPKRIEKPLTYQEAAALIQKYIEAENLPKIFPRETNLANLLELIKRYRVRKQEVFDAVLVATMIDNYIKVIYTGDERFFKKLAEIKVVNPFK